VIRAANFCQLVPILAYIEPTRVRCFWPEWKSSKRSKIWFLDILECIGCVRGKNSLRDSRCELLSINANIGIFWAPTSTMFYDRNVKVLKAPRHDFWTCWSVLGAFVAKTHFVTRAANFCQLEMLECIGCVRGKNSLRISRGELLSISSNIGIYWAPTGTMFLTGMKKFKKHQDMIFRHIGVYWVRSWQKLTSRFERRTFVN
jgi:hypothetical protein